MERSVDLCLRDGVRPTAVIWTSDFAQAFEQRKPESAVAGLLVVSHETQDFFYGDIVRQCEGKPKPLERGTEMRLRVGVCHPEVCAELHLNGHTDGNAFTVQQCVTTGGFHGVADGVTEVQHGAATLLAFIVHHDGRLDRNAAGYQCTDRFAVVPDDFTVLVRQPGQIFGIGYRAVLDGFRYAGGELFRRQCLERGDVYQNELRLMERANQVLAGARIYTSLATDGAVDHGEQCRGYLYKGDAAHVGRRDKPRDVTDNSAANGDHGTVAPDTALYHLIRDGAPCLARLVGFTGWEGDQLRGRHVADAVDDLLGVQGGNVRVADHDIRRGRTGVCNDGGEFAQQAVAEQDIVRCLAECNGNGGGGYNVTSPEMMVTA